MLGRADELEQNKLPKTGELKHASEADWSDQTGESKGLMGKWGGLSWTGGRSVPVKTITRGESC